MFQIALDLSIHNVNGYDRLNNFFPIKDTRYTRCENH